MAISGNDKKARLQLLNTNGRDDGYHDHHRCGGCFCTESSRSLTATPPTWLVAQAGASLLQHATQNMMREHILSDDHKTGDRGHAPRLHVDKHLSDLLIASSLVLLIVLCMICMTGLCCFSRYVATGTALLVLPLAVFILAALSLLWRRQGGDGSDGDGERGCSGSGWTGGGPESK